ncbi:hypothetical protein, partial [Escherichia coli]|uniref:hypothetical protein n=1 Tax=Escherichia coli TaxID=562 RepID=UPI001BDD5314
FAYKGRACRMAWFTTAGNAPSPDAYNENFSMHPQFLVWCLTFGAQFIFVKWTLSYGIPDLDH